MTPPARATPANPAPPVPAPGSKWGRDHELLRAKLINRWRPGDPCNRCAQPMMGPPARIHLGHPDAGNGNRYGLEHDTCNTSAGGTLGAERRWGPGGQSRDRTCPICAAPYQASHTRQLACSREHAAMVRRGETRPPSGRPW